MNRKVYTMFLTLLMSMVGQQVYAGLGTSAKVEVNGLCYYLDVDNLQAQVTDMLYGGKYSGVIIIPSDFDYQGNKYSVTSIGSKAFLECRSLNFIDISGSVTSIGDEAFKGCSGLTSVTIPNSVKSIGDGAFYGCTDLASVDMSNRVMSIGNNAFANCRSLTSITIPNGVMSIGEGTFKSCTKLTSITIPNSVLSIGAYAFSGCSRLTSLTIPNSVARIGEGAFSGCLAINSITIQHGVTTIGGDAFKDCTGLTSISIPNSVTGIGAGAFSGCSNLTTVEVDRKSPPSAGKKAFPTDHSITLYVPRGSKTAYETAYVWRDFSSIVEFGVMVTANDQTMFYGDAVPVFTYKIEGGSVRGTPEITCEATSTSPVGTYSIVISRGTIDSDNVTYVNGKLTINKAPLTITAKSYVIKQGQALPTFAAEYSGFKNNETTAVLATLPAFTTSATSASAPGTYDIVVYGASASNYDVTHVKGTLTITEADPVTVTAKSYSREYGEANPTFEYTTSGAPLTGMPTISCEATATSPVGDYDIVLSKGTITNYNVTLVNGKLTVTKAPLTIAAISYVIKQGDAIPNFEAVFGGFKNNETASVLSAQPTFSTTATSASAPGTYDIIVSGASAANYDITYVKGTLTITEGDPVTVTAKSYSREYGEANPAFEYTTSGATLIGTPDISCVATATSPVGDYDIVVSKGTVTNYNVTFVYGKLTVTKAPLTITAKSYTIKQGEDLPLFEVEYAGFKNNETPAVLTTLPVLTTSATSASEPGTYDIVVYGASATNYGITHVKGTLTISAVEVEPVTETETTTFSESLNEDTDLSNTIINNTYYTLNEENGDGYDASEAAVVVNSTTTTEQMIVIQDAKVGDATMQENYSGIIFEVSAGSGTVAVEGKTLGSHILNVQIGNGEPTKIINAEHGTVVDVPYNVTEPTYVYLYASTSENSQTPHRAAAANSVLFYSYRVTVATTGIQPVTDSDQENAKWYTTDGRQLQGKPTKKGLYIVNGRKVVVK